MRNCEIEGIFVTTMNEAWDRTYELISHYREGSKVKKDMINEIQKKLLNSWPKE